MVEGIAVVGSGEAGRRVSRLVAEAGAKLSSQFAGLPEPRALIVAGPVPHAAALVRRTLEEGVPALVIDPQGFDETTLRRLANLARLQRTHLQLIRQRLTAPAFELARAHLRRGQERGSLPAISIAVTLPASSGDADILAAAEEALVVMTQLAGVPPRSVGALHRYAGPDDDEGSPLLATALYEDGSAGQVRVLPGGREAFEIEIADSHAVFRVDLDDPRAPALTETAGPEGARVRTFAAATADGAADDGLRSVITQCWLAGGAGAFVDVGVELRATRLRAALLASIDLDGQPQAIGGFEAELPDLRLIVGRGQGSSEGTSRPRLRLVDATS